MDFEKFWKIHNPKPEYAHMQRYCRKIWDTLPPEKQELICQNICTKREKGQFVDFNPYYAIQKNGTPPRQQILSFNDYYARYGTTEPQDGWKMANPNGNKVIYVKTT